MKALTICQPYAELIMRGDKLVENRNWPTRYRGTLLIHAGKNKRWWNDAYALDPDALAWGAIVGAVEMIDCLRAEKVAEKHPALAGHPHIGGPWCWVFARGAVRFNAPIVMNGSQGLWEYSGSIDGAL